MTISPEDLRLAMRQWTTGVAVVTTVVDGVRHGMTVNSFTSVSLTPPLVLVSLEKTTRTYHMVLASGFFGVTILSAGQQEISDCFAGRHTEHEDRFDGLKTHTLVTGAPFIEGGLVYLDCQVTHTVEVETHMLFIAEVVAMQFLVQSENGGDPLIYHNRTYRRLQK